ncbi:MAG TPA: MBL fold metallo-hydrolase [Terriglobia bacterium]|nr:MBL fold metallo-hydrolase [Terriglobia bacterium]
MRRLLIVLALYVVSAYGQTPEVNVIARAAEALGGKNRILALKTLTIHGYGQQAYQNGGGNITASPDAPQKWVNVNGLQRTIDLEHGRMRLQQRLVQDFVFAYARNMNGDTRVHQVLDGDIAYNIGADGRPVRAAEAAVRTRRVDMLGNPVSIVRAALDPGTKLNNLRKEGDRQVLDLATARGDKLTLAIDGETYLPAWVSWVGPDNNLGDVTYRTYFVGYQVEKGVMLPAGYNTTMNFRNVVWNKLYVDRNVVDGPVEDMTAPAAVKSAPSPSPPQLNVEAIPVAKGVWYLRGAGGNSTLFEFDDHLTMFEAYGSEANAKANIDKARSVVPGKPLTEVIVSHHHFDHSGGLRTAVAERLAIITHRGNVDLFKEMASRPATQFPDALARNPKPIKIRAVDDHLVLKDKSMEVHVYRVISNSHMANGIFAYAPAARVVAEGDLVDEGWDIVWWGNSYPDSVNYWKLQVDRGLPVHGNMHTYAEVIELLKKQTRNAQDLCDRVEKAHLAMQGCPVTNVF